MIGQRAAARGLPAGDALLVAVDGGGSGCRAAIADLDGRRLGEGQAGPANFSSDPHATIANVLAAIAAARAQAGLPRAALDGATVHAGLAGIMTPTDANNAEAALPFARASVTDDRPTMMAGALGGRDGLLAAIGTGSFVGVRQGGAQRFFGGYGLEVGDQASGAWLGRAALTQSLLAHDGLTVAGEMTGRMMDRFDGDPVAAAVFAYRAGPTDFAALAPVVFEAATGGDAQALALLRGGAGYLAACIAAAKLRAGDVICLAGGIGPLYADHLDPASRARLCASEGSALDGALTLARGLYEALGPATGTDGPGHRRR